MKHLISINISENKKEKTKEKKIKEIVKGGKDKKREKNKDRGKEKVKDRGKNKDKEEELSKDNENDESEENMIEVNYSIETLEKSKTTAAGSSAYTVSCLKSPSTRRTAFPFRKSMAGKIIIVSLSLLSDNICNLEFVVQGKN